MPKEDIPVTPGGNSDDNLPASTALEQDETKSECSVNVNNDPVSLKEEPNSDQRLFQRHVGNGESEKNMKEVKEKPDHQGDASPATLDVGDLQTMTLGYVNKLDVLKDENDLAKGVVLNATQLYRPRDVHWVPESLSDDKTKDHELVQSYLVAGNQVESPNDKKDLAESPEASPEKMSLVRKIVFGFSFLPSVLFVLCFAVILPCENPSQPVLCSKELWSARLNDTDISTNFGSSDGFLIISTFVTNNRISSFNASTGDKIWTLSLGSSPTQVECGHFDANGDGVADCLVMLEGGLLYAFDVSNGLPLWNYTFATKDTSKFVLLSDCNGDGVQEIAVAVSPREIQVISNGYPRLPVNLYGCRTTPTKLTAWTHDGKTSLVFVCQTDFGKGTVRLLRQENWCVKEKKLKEEGFELLNSLKDNVDVKDILLSPAEEGLVAWAEDVVVFFQNDERELWSTVVKNHSRNKDVFYGNFLPNEKHVVLISGDPTSHSQITLINTTSGNETATHSIPFTDTKNAVLIEGGEKDYILILLKELRIREAGENTSATELSVTTIPTKAEDTTDVFNLPKSVDIRYRLVLSQFEMQDNVPIFKERDIRTESISDKEETTRLTAALEGNNLQIFMGRTLRTNSNEVSSIVQVFQVDYWNETIDSSRCKQS